MRSFNRLPALLQILCVVLLNIPVWAAIFQPLPWTVYATDGLTWSLIQSFSFFLGPLATGLSLLQRSFAFLPLLAVEILTLFLQSLDGAHQTKGLPPALGYGLGGLLLVFGLLIVNRNTLFPFFARGQRSWRRAERLWFNKRVELLRSPDDTVGLPAFMNDCSLTGMGLAGQGAAMRALLGGLSRDDAVYVQLSLGRRRIVVRARLIRLRDEGELCQVGLAVDDRFLMAELIASMPNGRRSVAIQRWIAKHWARSSLRRAAFGISTASTAMAFMVPSCGTDHENHRRNTAASAEADAGRSKDVHAVDFALGSADYQVESMRLLCRQGDAYQEAATFERSGNQPFVLTPWYTKQSDASTDCLFQVTSLINTVDRTVYSLADVASHDWRVGASYRFVASPKPASLIYVKVTSQPTAAGTTALTETTGDPASFTVAELSPQVLAEHATIPEAKASLSASGGNIPALHLVSISPSTADAAKVLARFTCSDWRHDASAGNAYCGASSTPVSDLQVAVVAVARSTDDHAQLLAALAGHFVAIASLPGFAVDDDGVEVAVDLESFGLSTLVAVRNQPSSEADYSLALQTIEADIPSQDAAAGGSQGSGASTSTAGSNGSSSAETPPGGTTSGTTTPPDPPDTDEAEPPDTFWTTTDRDSIALKHSEPEPSDEEPLDYSDGAPGAADLAAIGLSDSPPITKLATDAGSCSVPPPAVPCVSVIDRCSGKPLADVAVDFENTQGHTDANGKYCSLPPPGSPAFEFWMTKVAKEGYVGDPKPPMGASIQHPNQLGMVPATSPRVIQVVGCGRVDGANVVVKNNGKTVFEGTTNSDGTLTAPLPNGVGSFQVTASAPDYDAQTQNYPDNSGGVFTQQIPEPCVDTSINPFLVSPDVKINLAPAAGHICERAPPNGGGAGFTDFQVVPTTMHLTDSLGGSCTLVYQPNTHLWTCTTSVAFSGCSGWCPAGSVDLAYEFSPSGTQSCITNNARVCATAMGSYVPGGKYGTQRCPTTANGQGSGSWGMQAVLSGGSRTPYKAEAKFVPGDPIFGYFSGSLIGGIGCNKEVTFTVEK